MVALRQGYTTFTDPVVGKIQKFLALARQNVPFLEAAQRVGLPFEVIETLAIMGLQAIPTQPEPERIIPQPPSTNSQTETAQDKLNFPIPTPTPVQIKNRYFRGTTD
ncbi:hypothetical protein ACL6C3_13985 [Capilliphycus salinus ALCB114379]|uniref:hypothetical protein n=1 Tax=Capilliphycus salinus TaxID=2768948 RepID=UPI0039A4EC65